jgi:hypothetical protein
MRWLFILLLVSLKIHPHHTRTQINGGFAIVAASQKYCCPSLFERIFFGSNYRREWTTMVTMPVFDIKKTNFRIVEMGGGQQTTSLELLDEENREWALRSVDKYVKPDDKITGNIFIRAIIQDHISAAYPYAGLSIPGIGVAAGIPAGEQHLYFVPDDTSFGKHRSVMANKVFILVNNQPQKEKGITTEEMLVKLRSDKQCHVDAKEYLKARLVDWLVGDWDRHDEQWRWIERKTSFGIAFCVVPRDRDQAFYRSNGLLTKFVGSFFMPHIDRFNKNAKGIKGLSEKSWALDKQFMSSLKKADWEMTIKEFQKNVSDSVIESSIKKQPAEIFAIRGNKMIEKLRSRRDGLLKEVMKYYLFLSQSSG